MNKRTLFNWQYTGIALLLLLFLCRIIAGFYDDPVFFGKADFAVFYTTAEFALDNQDIYGNEALQDAITTTRDAEGSVRYLYPPAVLILFLPLTIFSFKTAVWLWLGLNCIMLFATIWLLEKIIQVKPKHNTFYWLIALSCITIYTPIFVSLRTGQVNIFLMFLLVVHLFLFNLKKFKWASLVVAGMIIIKLFPVILLAYYLIKKQYSFVEYTLAWMLTLFIITLPITSLDNHTSYIQRAYNQATQGIHQTGLHRYDNPTINGELYRATLMNKIRSADRKNYKPLLVSLNKIKENLLKTDITLRMSLTDWIAPTHLVLIVLFGLGLLIVSILIRTTPPNIVEISLWFSFVFLAAKDAHIEYFVLLLPVFIFIFMQKKVAKTNKYKIIIPLTCLILFAVSWINPLPYTELPAQLIWIPTALLANLMLFFYLLRLVRSYVKK
ncbi:MAG: glycosyltransferase family 87 protein [bacterium]|nr:glycosyltransferase family 87 protein [bacterium]